MADMSPPRGLPGLVFCFWRLQPSCEQALREGLGKQGDMVTIRAGGHMALPHDMLGNEMPREQRSPRLVTCPS